MNHKSLKVRVLGQVAELSKPPLSRLYNGNKHACWGGEFPAEEEARAETQSLGMQRMVERVE